MWITKNQKIAELEERIIELEMAMMRFPELYKDKKNTRFGEKIQSSKIMEMLREKDAKMPASERLKTFDPDLRKRLTALYKKWTNPNEHHLSRQETLELQYYGLIWREHA